jgi:glucokinase
MPSFSIGVDLGGTNLRIAAVTTDGQLLEKITLGVKVIQGRDQVLNEMCAAIDRLSAKYKADREFRGAGVGVPGIIDMATGTLRKSANLPGWEDYPVRAEIGRRLRSLNKSNKEVPVVLENDANVAALGEQWLGAARGVANAATVTLGTGIGGGIVLNGKIWHGMNGMAGEFGHVTVEPEGVPCPCGNRGCAERYASANAVMRMVREAIAAGKAPEVARASSSDPEFGARSVYNLAIQGDEHARRIFRTFGRYLGILIAGLINLLNLDMYVIGGGVSGAWDAFAPTMFEEVRQRSLVYAATAPDDPLRIDIRGDEGASAETESSGKRKTIVTRALLGSDAGLYGAARVSELAA